MGVWKVWEDFSEEEGFEMDFKGCVEVLKEREGHSSCENSLGKGFGYRNESYLFRDSKGTNMYLMPPLGQASGWTLELRTWSLLLKQAQPSQDK